MSPGELKNKEYFTPSNYGGYMIEYLRLYWIILVVD